MRNELERLWSLLPHINEVGEESVVRWFARKGDTRVGEFAQNVAELALAAESYPDLNFYVQPNPTYQRCGTRVNADDVTRWSWLFLDVDPVAEVYEPAVALETHLAHLRAAVDCELSPTIIDSGRGYQAWLRLADVHLDSWCGTCNDNGVGRQRRRKVRQSMGYWLKRLDAEVGVVAGCRLDTSCSDLPRVMRCPGTVNLKTGLRARIITEGSKHEDLHTRLLELTPEQEFVVVQPSALTDVPWQMVYPKLTLTARRYIDDGREEPGRHKAAMAAAYSLRDAGLPADEAFKALQQGNSRSAPPMSEGDLRRVLDNAFRE